MNLKNNYFLIAFVAIAVVVLICIFASANNAFSGNTYVNVTPDGAIKFDTTGFEVNEMDVIEEVYTGQLDNKTFYNLKDCFGREAEIAIHHTSLSNTSSSEYSYLHSTYLQSKAKWVGNYSGQYYSVSVTDSNDDNYFNKEFIDSRIIKNQ